MKSSAHTSSHSIGHSRAFFVFLLGFLLFHNPLPLHTAESSGANILFILDASGSMWAKVEQKEKIAIAKDVMTNLIKELPERIKVGLEVYGHRSKGDCNDIEMMAPIGQEDKGTLIKRIQSIQPKGETPIAKSLEIAGEHLKEVEGETTVVLVSDGKESCKGDPCALVKALQGKGIKVTLHVVGFGVTSEEKQQLSCIAEAGGGKYFTAQNANQLKGALTEVKQKVIEKVETKVAPKEVAQVGSPKMATLPKGGDRPETAVPLAMGDYFTDRALPKDAREYYALKVQAGQVLLVKFRTPDAASPYAGAAIYNEGQELLAQEDIVGDASTLKTTGWLTNAAQEAYTFYIGVGNGYEKNAKGTMYSFSLEEKFDAGTSSDAGDDFDKALRITPGTHKGFLAGNLGDDRKDFYVIALKEGDKVNLKVTPPKDVQYTVSIWDEDRVQVAEKTAANPGAIARAAWTAPSAQEVYLLIEPSTVPAKSISLTYTMEVTVGP